MKRTDAATRRSSTLLESALKEESPLRQQVHVGLQALSRLDKARVDDEVKKEVGDSIDLDKALLSGAADKPRWDYILGGKGFLGLVGLEPHGATDGQVKKVIAKKREAERVLAQELKPGRRVVDWLYASSGDTGFTPGSKSAFRLSEEGIRPVGSRLKKKDITWKI